jgi:hypothetical protein
MKKIVLIASLLIPQFVFSQDFLRYFSLSWDVNKPLTNTNWIDETSFIGTKFSYRSMITDRFAAGVDFTWSTYKHYQPWTTFMGPDGALSTDYFNYIYAYGLMAGGQYFLPSSNPRKFMPFVGLGAGVAYNRFAQYYNIYTDPDEGWGFVARPEVGILLPFGSKVGIQATAHYDYTTAGSEYFDYSGFQHYGFTIGLVLMSY